MVVVRIIGSAFLLLALTQPLAHAAKEVGNGGDVILCGDQIEVLDVFEARVVLNLSFRWSPEATTPVRMVEASLLPLASASPARYRDLLGWAQNFMDETAFLSGLKLKDIPDSSGFPIPAGCWVEQIAIQSPPRFEGDPRYVIDGDLWARLDDSGRAALILHEIVYRAALEEGHVNSRHARYFTAMLGSGFLDGVTPNGLYWALRAIDFDRGSFEAAGYLWEISIRTSLVKRLREATIPVRLDLLGPDQEVEIHGMRFTPSRLLRFHSNGKLALAGIRPGSIVSGPGFFVIAQAGPFGELPTIRFDAEGELISISGERAFGPKAAETKF